MEVTLFEWFIEICGAVCKSVTLVLCAVFLAALMPFKMLSALTTRGTQRKQFTSVLITGAAAGIGAEFARQLARPGVRLTLIDRQAAKLDAVKRECEARGATVVACVIDVTDAAAMAATIAKADDDGALDLVIANAGLHSLSLHSETKAPLVNAVHKVTNVDVMGVVNTLAPITSRMQARGRGQVVLMASLASLFASGDPWWTTYMACKAWVRAYGLGLRGALKPYGVGVTVLCPSLVHSEMVDMPDPYLGADDTTAQPPPSILATDYAVGLMIDAIERNAPELFLPWHEPLTFAPFMLNVLPSCVLDMLPVKPFTPWPTAVEAFVMPHD